MTNRAHQGAQRTPDPASARSQQTQAAREAIDRGRAPYPGRSVSSVGVLHNRGDQTTDQIFRLQRGIGNQSTQRLLAPENRTEAAPPEGGAAAPASVAPTAPSGRAKGGEPVGSPTHHAVADVDPASTPVQPDPKESDAHDRLPKDLQSFFEERFQHDFGAVRIHTGGEAADTAESVGVNAFTIGDDIVFARGSYTPRTPAGIHRVAHELAHVVQQSRAETAHPSNGVDADLEADANAAATAAVRGDVAHVSAASGPRVACEGGAPPIPAVLGFLKPSDIQKLKGFGDADFKASMDTLVAQLGKTRGFTAKGNPHEYVNIRQASGELRTFVEYVNDPNVVAIKALPGSTGGRSPDMYVRYADNTTARVEVYNITLAPDEVTPDITTNEAGRLRPSIPRDEIPDLPNKFRVVLPTTEFKHSAVKDAILSKISATRKGPSQLDAQNVNTLAGGKPMTAGGDVVIQISHGRVDKKLLDDVIKDIEPQLNSSSARRIVIDAVEVPKPGAPPPKPGEASAGRKLFVYTRSGDGFTGTVRSPNRSVEDAKSLTSSATSSSAISGPTGSAPTKAASAADNGKPAGNLESQAIKATAKREEAATATATAKGLLPKAANRLTQAEQKQVWQATAESFTKLASARTARRLAQATTPVVGALFAAPDIKRGGQDIAHGNIALGASTIGVALVDIAAQTLHLTDEVTAGGGTALALTIQAWCTAMQMSLEMARLGLRANELQTFVRTHNGALPPRNQLMSYYGLNDEDILILENDIQKASTVTLADVIGRLQSLIAEIDAAAASRNDVDPAAIAVERAKLGRLLTELKALQEAEKQQAAKAYAAAVEKARQERLDQAIRAQQRPVAPAQQQAAVNALLPGPAGAGHGLGAPARVSADFGPFLSPQPASPAGVTMEKAEIAATWFGRERSRLLENYAQLENAHFPDDQVKAFRAAVTKHVEQLDLAINVFSAKGSAEWLGVKTMRQLRDAAETGDRNRLMR